MVTYKSERGQSVPFAALLMLVSFGALTVIVNLGARAVDLAGAQTAADAAALAAAATSDSMAISIASQNGSDSLQIERQASRVVVRASSGTTVSVAAAEVDTLSASDDLAPALQAAIATAEDLLGQPIPIASGRRSAAEQQWLWDNRHTNPYPVARPGTSNHELGLAIDVPSWFAPTLARIGPLSGLCQPLPVSDPVHFQLCRRK